MHCIYLNLYFTFGVKMMGMQTRKIPLVAKLQLF